ncbi:unnamed protein product [Ilex paraguariensis]|uniref:Polygalacturonase n=1 Tax=Ilex paraguariensis TaxID=185542 RepID=A0ABC8RZT5_9AQUA
MEEVHVAPDYGKAEEEEERERGRRLVLPSCPKVTLPLLLYFKMAFILRVSVKRKKRSIGATQKMRIGLNSYKAANIPCKFRRTTYNVLNFGAKPDGRTDSTKSFLGTWAAACGSVKPATIYVPRGRYLLHKAHFAGNCKNTAITIIIDGTLLAPSDYHVIGNAHNWVLFEGVNGVSIRGGMLDGQGAGLWACKATGKSCPRGATTLGFTDSNNIEINGLTSLNSQIFHIVINGCHNVKLQGVKVLASGNSPNTDGIHVQLSSGVTILNIQYWYR